MTNYWEAASWIRWQEHSMPLEVKPTHRKTHFRCRTQERLFWEWNAQFNNFCKFKINFFKDFFVCFAFPAILPFPFEPVTSAFCCCWMFYSAPAFFFFSGSPCIGSKRTSLRSYHRRPTSINHCLYDTAPLAFFSYFLRCPLWLRNLKSGWRHGTSYKCFSTPNVSTMPLVSRLFNTRARLWPLRTSNF